MLSEDGGRGEGDGKGFREELATLAKEVARLETVRVYAGWLFFQFFYLFLNCAKGLKYLLMILYKRILIYFLFE